MSDIELVQPPERGPRWGPKAWIAFSALAALLVVIALARRNRSAREDREERLPYVVLPSGDPAPSAAPATPAGGLAQHLTQPPSGPAPDGTAADPEPARTPAQLPFKDFVARLKAIAEAPEAEKSAEEFSKEFNKQPELKKTFDDFKKRAEAGEPVKAGEFLDAVRAKAEFRQLVARFSSQPATASIYSDPVLRNLVLEKLDAPKNSVAREARRSDRRPSAVAESQAGRPGAAQPATSRSTGGEQTLAIARAQSGGAGAIASGGFSTTGRGGPGPAGGEGGAPGSNKAAGGGGGGGGSGGPAQALGGKETPAGESAPGAHDVQVRLPAPDAATSEVMQLFLEKNPWLAQLGPERLGRIEALISPHGLWGSCFALKLYPECKAACASDPQKKCLATEAWTSCREWTGHAECVSACRYASGYCAVPPEIEGPECQTTKMCSCGKDCSKPCPPPPYEYCKPSWPGDAPAPPAAAAEPLPPVITPDASCAARTGQVCVKSGSSRCANCLNANGYSSVDCAAALANARANMASMATAAGWNRSNCSQRDAGGRPQPCYGNYNAIFTCDLTAEAINGIVQCDGSCQ